MKVATGLEVKWLVVFQGLRFQILPRGKVVFVLPKIKVYYVFEIDQ